MPFKSARDVYNLIGTTEGGTSPERCAELFEFVRKERPLEVLELGFAYGESTTYIAAALEANGAGRVTSVDLESAHDRVPTAVETLTKANVRHRADLVYEKTSYNWYLHGVLRRQLKNDAITPLYDFCFLDGAHSWLDDALAFTLLERLMQPGGWILLDDVNWVYDEKWPEIPDEEKRWAQVQEVLELLAIPNPMFDEIRSDGRWAWVRKSREPVPAVRVVTRQDWMGPVSRAAQVVRARAGRKARELVNRGR